MHKVAPEKCIACLIFLCRKISIETQSQHIFALLLQATGFTVRRCFERAVSYAQALPDTINFMLLVSFANADHSDETSKLRYVVEILLSASQMPFIFHPPT